MADYFTQFSFGVMLTREQATTLKNHRLYRDFSDLVMGATASLQKDVLYIYAEECGDLEQLVDWLQTFRKALGVTSPIGFTYAVTCSKPRVDSFGGGYYIVGPGADVVKHLDVASAMNAEIEGTD